jgi:hypothetical protein
VKRFTTILAACVALASAAGFQVQGNMSEAWDKGMLAVRAGEDGAKIWFSLPAHSGITVVAKPDTGATVKSVLNMSATVSLPLPSKYEVTITRDSGDGQWTCKDAAGSPALLGFGTSVDVKRHAHVTYVADDEKEIWTFNCPRRQPSSFRSPMPRARSPRNRICTTATSSSWSGAAASRLTSCRPTARASLSQGSRSRPDLALRAGAGRSNVCEVAEYSVTCEEAACPE